MKTMNNIYEAPKADVIEMNLTGAVLVGSNGDATLPGGLSELEIG